jgi:glutamine synthetase
VDFCKTGGTLLAAMHLQRSLPCINTGRGTGKPPKIDLRPPATTSPRRRGATRQQNPGARHATHESIRRSGMSENTLQMIKDNDVRWVDLRFTDPRGKEQHTTFPAKVVDADFMTNGAMFDGSSVAGWKGINESDMILMPDDETAVLDPFTEDTTLILRCDVIEPTTMQPYERDPRGTARKAEAYLAESGIGDVAYFGPEAEFFVFDDVRFKVEMSGSSYAISAEEAAWESNSEYEGGNLGHRPGIKGGYFPVPPVDSSFDLRNSMCNAM